VTGAARWRAAPHAASEGGGCLLQRLVWRQLGRYLVRFRVPPRFSPRSRCDSCQDTSISTRARAVPTLECTAREPPGMRLHGRGNLTPALAAAWQAPMPLIVRHGALTMNWLRFLCRAEASRTGTVAGNRCIRERYGQKNGGTPWQSRLSGTSEKFRTLAACRREQAMAHYKALRLVRSRPFA
jgi:hypothetical protein